MPEPLPTFLPGRPSFLKRIIAFCPPLILSLAAWGCLDFSLVTVRQETLVYEDGALSRGLTVEGVNENFDPPEEPDWLRSKAGVALADPGAWTRVEETPARITAEVLVPPGVPPPPSIRIHVGDGMETVRENTEVVRRDLVVAESWAYRQVVADPEAPEPVETALRRVTDAAASLLERALEREFGEDPAIRRAVLALRAEWEPLLVQLVPPMVELLRRPSRAPDLLARIRGLLAEAGLGSPPGLTARDSGADDAFVRVLDGLLQAARVRTAELLRRAGLAEAYPETLDFWPDASAIESFLGAPPPAGDPSSAALHEALGRFADRTLLAPDPEGFGRRWIALEFTVRLPGVILRTNGVPLDEPGGVFFVHRGLPAPGAAPFEALSARPDDEALRAMGARRAFSSADLARLVELLLRHDPSGALGERLRLCVREGSLEPLLDWLPEEGQDFEAEAAGVTPRSLVELLRLLDPDIGGSP